MMDPSTIRSMADDAARKARKAGREPYGFFDEDDVDTAVRSLPFLGNYVPRGFKLTETLFVDSSGFGRDGEAAMTFARFTDRVRADVKTGNAYHYAIVESGQFQVYIGVYERVTPKVRRAPADRPHEYEPAEGFLFRGKGRRRARSGVRVPVIG